MDKQANPPIAAQLAMAILGVSLLQSNQQNVEDHQAEAMAMNETFRELEARKMDQTTSALKHAAAQLGPALRAAAMEASTGMDKESMGALIGGLASAAKQRIGGAAQAAGRLMPRFSTKQKLIGGAALAGTAYAGYKGMQAVQNYGMAPPHEGTWGKGAPIAHNVNEFGYPQH